LSSEGALTVLTMTSSVALNPFYETQNKTLKSNLPMCISIRDTEIHVLSGERPPTANTIPTQRFWVPIPLCHH
jgi:hypothetical protein